MRIHIYMLLCILIIGVACSNRSANSSFSKSTKSGNLTTGIIDENISSQQITDEDKLIIGSQVGNISTGMSIDEITTNLPSGYKIEEYFEIFDGDEPDNITNAYNVYDTKGVIRFRIVSRENTGYSIMVFSPEYSIYSTGIKVGNSIKELKKHYVIENFYFNIADGLYLYVKGFNGVFLVDLENRGDSFNNMEDLHDDYKIKAIIIN